MIRCSFFRSRLLLSCLALEVMVLSPFGAAYGGDGWQQDEQTGLEMRMVAAEVNGGTESEHRLEVRTQGGVLHVVERSTDLLDWQEVGRVYGYGHEFAVPVVRTGLGGEAGGIPEDDTPPPSYPDPGWRAFVTMRRVAAEVGGGILVTWRALDGDGMRGMVVPDVIMPDDRGLSFSLGEWGEVQAGYTGSEPLAVTPSVVEPSGLDIAVASRILADFPAWAAAVMDYIETAVPVRVEGAEGERRFFRVRTVTGLDSDFDTLIDELEFAEGTDPFSPDSDGDGVSDARERELGTDPTKHAEVTDSDGDGLMDDIDADPGDAAVRWSRTSAPGYVAIGLGKPIEASESLPPDFAVNEHFGLKDLSEDGRVIAASDPVREALEPWSNLFWYGQPDEAYFVTKVWEPATGDWSESLSTDPYLPAVGWRFNGLGDLYGEGYGAFANEEYWLGMKDVATVWRDDVNGYGNAVLHGGTDEAFGAFYGDKEEPHLWSTYAWSPDAGFADFQGSAAGADTRLLQRITYGEGIVGEGNGSSPDYLVSAVLVDGERVEEIIVTTSPYNTPTPGIGSAGCPAGWIGLSVAQADGNGGYQSFTHQLRKVDRSVAGVGSGTVGRVVNAPPVENPVGEMAEVTVSETGEETVVAVVWQSMSWVDGEHELSIGYGDPDAGDLVWHETSRLADDPLRLRGRVNARGEALDGNRLWRNAEWKSLDELAGGTGWTGLEGIDMNDSGMVIATGFPVDENGTVSTTREGVLLVPVELNVFPPKPTEKLLLENQSFEDRWELTEHYISADDREMWVTATVYVPGWTDEGVPTMVPAEDGTTVNWEIVEGTGGSLSSTSSETEIGMAAVKLTTSVEPEARFVVEATLDSLSMKLPDGAVLSVDGGDLAEELSQDIVVFPGEPATMIAVLKRDGQAATSMPADEASEMEVRVELKDAHGNPVARGTRVYWMLRGMGEIVEIQELVEGEDGKATATVRAGDIAETQKLVIQAENLQQELEIINTAVEATLTSSASSLELGGSSVTLTLSAPEVADGAPVSWDVSQGELSSVDDEITNGGASATLAVNEGAAGKVVAIARVGDKVTNLSLDLNGRAGKPEITVEHPVIAWDLDEDGVEAVPVLEGADEMVAVHAAAVVKVKDPTRAGQLLDVSVTGSSVSENHRFRFDAEVAGTTPDAHTALVATMSDGAVIDSSAPREGAGALSLPNTLAKATIPHAPGLSLDADTLIGLAMKSDGSAGTILEKAGEYKLDLNAGGFPVLTVGDVGAQTIVTSTVPTVPGMWHKLGVSRDQGAWVLTVDGVREAETGPQLSAATNAAVVLGGVVCDVDELLFSRRTSSLAGGLQADVAGLDAGGKLQLDANGEGQFTVGASVPQGQEPTERVIQPLDITVSAADGTTETAEAAVVVTDKRSAALIKVIGGSATIMGNLEGYDPNYSDSIVSGWLRKMLDDKPRTMVPAKIGGDRADRALFGYRIAIWLEEYSDEAGEVHRQAKVYAEGLPDELEQIIAVHLQILLAEAAARPNFQDFNTAVINNSGEFRDALEALSLGDTVKFAELAGAIDSAEARDLVAEMAELTGGEKFADAVKNGTQVFGGKIEGMRRLINTFSRERAERDGEGTYFKVREFSALQKDIIGWAIGAGDSSEPYLKQAVQGMKNAELVPAECVALIGWVSGVVKVLEDGGVTVANSPELVAAIADLSGLVIDAAKDEEGARESLKLLGEAYIGSAVKHLEGTHADWEAGNYYEAGFKSVAIAGVAVTAGGGSAKSLLKRLQRDIKDLRLSQTARNMVRLKQWQIPYKKFIGQRAETLVRIRLSRKGFTDIVPVQNNSGHGLDLICRDPWGGITVVEVKGHQLFAMPKLSLKQKQGYKDYALDRLETGRIQEWYGDDLVLRDRMLKLENDIQSGATMRGIVVNVDWVLSKHPLVSVRDWLKGCWYGGELIGILPP